MQMSQMLPSMSPEQARASGNGEKTSDKGGTGFGELHSRIVEGGGGQSRSAAASMVGKEGGKAGKLSLSEGDVLKDAEGNVIGEIIKGEDGELSLLLDGEEGKAINLDKLMALFEAGGESLLQQFASGEGLRGLEDLDLEELGIEGGNGDKTADSGLVGMLASLDETQRQGVLSALATAASAKSGSSSDDLQILPQGNSSGNSGGSLASILGLDGNGGGTSNASSRNAFLQGLLSGEFSLSGKGSDQQNGLRFEGIKLAAVDSGSESASRNSETVNSLLQQNVSRTEGRESPLRQYSTSIETPVQQQAKWSEEVAGKIAWMAGRSIQSADIQLNPPDMGPIDVRVQVQNEQAQITVHAQNNAVRDMLELNSQRLRDMLEENGLDLAGFDVSGDAAENGGSDSERERQETGEPGGQGMVSQQGERVSTGDISIKLSEGIDTYA